MIWFGNGVSYGSTKEKILFDSPRKARKGTVFISHAHSDHLRNHQAETVMTPATARIADWKKQKPTQLDYGKAFNVGEFEVTAFPAGHVVGSAQFQVCDGQTMVYTGDFKTQDTALMPGAEPIPCDELVIETTFGRPEFSFPQREEVYEQIKSWTSKKIARGQIVLLGGYAVGKAQELTLIANEYCGVTPLVHPKVKKVNDACVESGAKLGEYISLESEQGKEASRDAFVAVIPPHLFSTALLKTLESQAGRRVSACIATGWAQTLSWIKAFPMSDHADYSQLLEYVKQAQPKRVHTVHGYASEFARSLRRLGFDAQPLGDARQRRLEHFC
jgi:Cft2 family RNA processing exonuclease